MADYNDFDWREKANIEIIEGKEAYLVDVPVCVMLWIRPDYQRQQYEVISKAKPSVLFLISDGGRNERENQLIAESRSVYDDISWNCTVYRMYFEKNQGMYSVWKYKTQMIWDCVEYCVFLEDDQIPAVTYFDFCRQNLEYYKEDEKVAAICGFNYQGISKNVEEYDYFFSHRYAIWGIAFWKRTYDFFECDHNELFDKKVRNTIKKNAKVNGYGNDFYAYIESYKHNKPILSSGSEYNLWLLANLKDKLFVFPTKNMISNIGTSEQATNCTEYNLLPRKLQRLFHSKMYELVDNIRKPYEYLENPGFDKFYQKALLTGTPQRVLVRKIIRATKIIMWKLGIYDK